MSMSRTAAPVRRVRHQARDSLVLAGFSALTSSGLAVALLALMSMGR